MYVSNVAQPYLNPAIYIHLNLYLPVVIRYFMSDCFLATFKLINSLIKVLLVTKAVTFPFFIFT